MLKIRLVEPDVFMMQTLWILGASGTDLRKQCNAVPSRLLPPSSLHYNIQQYWSPHKQQLNGGPLVLYFSVTLTSSSRELFLK